MKKKLLFVLSFFCLIFLFIAVGCNDNTPPADSDDGQTPSGESYTVTLVFDGARGSIELTPPAENNKYSKGTALTAAVTPLPGRVLNSFKADGEKKTLDGGKYTFTVEKDVTLEAVFDTVPMPADVLESLKGQRAYTGEGTELHIYDGYDDYPISYSYVYEVAFDGDLSHHSQYDNSMNLYLHNRIYKNENGKAVSYARLLDNTFNVTATNEDFGLFDNPFETLSAEDFIATGDGGYTLTDAAKASEAARAFTGVSEEIANFTVFAQNGKAYSIMIDTEKDIRGHGITMDYTYNANYFFDVAEFKELDGRIAPYPTAPEHAALKEALAAASAAQSYTYHVKEDAEYNFYVTEKAIYCDEESGDLGYYLYTDGLVHEIYLQNEQLILGDPLQIPSGSGSEYTTTSDLASLKPNFGAFAAELFEPKGNGVFEMHAEEVALLRETAQFLWNFNDYMTMSFAQSITITVKDNVLAEVSIETKLYMFTTTFTLTYSDWNETELPLPLTVPGGSATPAGTYPAKYYGKFAGSTWQNVAYAAEIDASAISFSIGGAPATVTNVNYDASADKILLTVNGTACNITPAGDKQTVDAITFAANDNQSLSSATLDRVPEGGGTGSVTIPEMFYGAFEGDDGEGEAKKHYEVTIAESGITATIDGEAITVTVTGYNVRYKELAIVFNGTPCNLSVSLDQNNKPLSISIMSTNDFSVNLTLYAVNAGGQQPAAGKEKFYGTYEGTYTPYDGETRTYHVTITADGIAVSINGTEATVTEVGYDEDMEEFTFKVNGAAYSISANSDDAPLTEIALWFEIFHSAILTRTA